MRQHVFAFLAALAVWTVGGLVIRTLAQGSGVSIRPATVPPSPSARVIVTDDAYCVQSSSCWAWYLFSCNGHLPNCNGGCWVTGTYPCSACVESPGWTCVQEQITVNAGLFAPIAPPTTGTIATRVWGITRTGDPIMSQPSVAVGDAKKGNADVLA